MKSARCSRQLRVIVRTVFHRAFPSTRTLGWVPTIKDMITIDYFSATIEHFHANKHLMKVQVTFAVAVWTTPDRIIHGRPPFLDRGRTVTGMYTLRFSRSLFVSSCSSDSQEPVEADVPTLACEGTHECRVSTRRTGQDDVCGQHRVWLRS